MQRVAEVAGVSRMTVSLALRNHPRIPLSTRQRIQRVARELGYQTDPEVARLMAYLRRARPTHQPGTIALLTTGAQPAPWKGNAHYRKFHDGASRRAAQLGYQLEEFWLKEPGMTAARLRKILHARSIEGVLIAPHSHPASHLSLNLTGLAVAEYGQNVWTPLLHRADHNQFQGMLLALRQLNRRDYGRIGLALFEGYDRRSIHTWEGAFHFFHRQHPRRLVIPPLIVPRLEQKLFRAWLNKHQPDAVVSSHLEVRDWIGSATGYVYLDWLDESHRCAGINQHYERIAAAAVDLVVEQLRTHETGVPARPKLVLLEGAWMDGPTVRPLAAALRGAPVKQSRQPR